MQNIKNKMSNNLGYILTYSWNHDDYKCRGGWHTTESLAFKHLQNAIDHVYDLIENHVCDRLGDQDEEDREMSGIITESEEDGCKYADFKRTIDRLDELIETCMKGEFVPYTFEYTINEIEYEDE